MGNLKELAARSRRRAQCIGRGAQELVDLDIAGFVDKQHIKASRSRIIGREGQRQQSLFAIK